MLTVSRPLQYPFTLRPSPISVIDNTLYQGCRSATKDQHYASEFKALVDQGQLVYRVACSRDGPPGVRRTYVQDLIAQDAKRVWDLIGMKRAFIYICG